MWRRDTEPNSSRSSTSSATVAATHQQRGQAESNQSLAADQDPNYTTVYGKTHWGAPLWSAEMEDNLAMWSVEEDIRLSRSVRESRVDDWTTLGDWSEVSSQKALAAFSRLGKIFCERVCSLLLNHTLASHPW